MIRCPDCNSEKTWDNGRCPECGFCPVKLDGFVAWSPDLAHSNEGYNPDAYAVLAANESANFWFQKRNELVSWALSRTTPEMRRFMEIGCGTGFVLNGISQAFPSARLSASEIFVSGLKFASERVPSAQFMQLDATQMPFLDEFDCIGAFDVIEHIEDDESVLRNSFRALKSGGTLILTVPQHQWLWSQSDEIAHHKRRYSRRELKDKLQRAGFEISLCTSFMMFLLPVMFISRRFAKKADGKANREISPPGLLNSLFGGILGLEVVLIKLGARLPLGGSLLVVARKPKADS